jgi:hypothetical protein
VRVGAGSETIRLLVAVAVSPPRETVAEAVFVPVLEYLHENVLSDEPDQLESVPPVPH